MTELERLQAENAEMRQLLKLAEKKLRAAAFRERVLKRMEEGNRRLEEYERNRPLRVYFGAGDTVDSINHVAH
jgi:hypothetical protein